MKALGLVVSLVGALTLVSVAQAAPATGTAAVEIQRDSKVGRALDDAGVKVAALAPAEGGRATELPIGALEVGPPISALAGGGIEFEAGKRRAKLKRLQLISGGDESKLRGAIGGKVMTLFEAKGVLTQSGSAEAPKLVLESGRLELTSRAARTISKKLRIDRLPSGNVGRIAVSVDLERSSTPLVVPPPDETPPDETPGGEAYPYGAQCPVATGPVTNAPQGAADPVAAPTLDLPQGVASSTAVEWGFLDSFRNYVINVPTAGTIQTLDGAMASAADLSAPGSFVSYANADGEYEAGNELNRSDDRLVAAATGTTLFCKSGHGFNVVMKNPTVTLDGGQSRLTMDVGANYGGTWFPAQRVDIATLDLTSVTPTPSAGGTTVTWQDIPATMTAEGAKALGLPNYPAGTSLDPVTVRTTLERPIQTACTLPSDGGATPAVDFTLEALPALGSTQQAVSGQLNWGFRGSLRGSVNATGQFLLFGGATRSDPASMSGAGKSFGFPLESASYEEGTPADPTDDRLVARSNATVVFCNPNAGSYGVVLSRPTLVLDGANSRLTANAYSFRSQTWGGGRVDLVSLSDVDPTYDAGAGTVAWSGITVTANRNWQGLGLAFGSPPSTAGYDPVSITIDLDS